MNKPVITVKSISKSYNISHEMKATAGNVAFRDAIINTLKKPKELLTGHIMKKEKFWALKDINFEINKGEVVGIIGKNGSGKSTLLKIMSRITEPTTGEIVMNGRVASLLEVGTGFHPELTGRENVYFNGSILGMKKKEIDAKFDEIVAFSEVEKFLDTPVKFYSSGMYVRLAFAVAAHLEPDILIVDEVLAVGDAAFQKKCLGKMKDVAGEGRTVIFVSHSMSSVRELCSKAVLLKSGKVAEVGDVEKVSQTYLKQQLIESVQTPQYKRDRAKNLSLQALLYDIKVTNHGNNEQGLVDSTRPISISMKIKSSKNIEFPIGIHLAINSGSGMLLRMQTEYTKTSFNFKKGINKVTCELPPSYLTGGTYGIDFSLVDLSTEKNEHIDILNDATYFTVKDIKIKNIKDSLSQKEAVFYLPTKWSELK